MNEEISQADCAETIEIETTPVILIIFYTLITAGIYYPCWFLTRREQINKLQSDEKLGKGTLIFALVVYSFSLLLYMVSGAFERFADFLDIFIWIIMVFQCFKVKRIFWDHFNKHLYKDVRFSEVATFFFGAFYLQYKINRFD